MVRITANLISNQSLYNLQKSIQRYARMQEIVSTGKSINQPRDNPVGYPVALSLRASILQGKSYQRNVESARSNLELTESTMNNLTENLQTIRTLAVQGADNLDSNARIALSDQVSELYDHLYDLANTSYNGQSLLGGSTTKSQAFSTKDGAVLYNGDDFQRNVLVSKDTKIVTNLNGYETFLHTPNQITGSVRIADADAPLSEQIRLANPNFPNLPTIPSKPEDSTIDPSPNSTNNPGETPNQYASFSIYGTEVRVDLTTDSLRDLVNRINATVPDAVASIDKNNCLAISSKRSDALDIQDGARAIGFEPDAPTGLNLMSALGMNRQVDGSRSMNRGYSAANPLTDPTVTPTPARSSVKVENRSFLFASTNTGPSSDPAVPFGDNLALTNIDNDGNEAYLANGNLDFIDDLEALRITIDEETIDVDLRSLTQGSDFDGVVGNPDDVAGSTMGDLLELINNHPQLQGKVTAYINADGTGIGLSAVKSADVFKVEDVRRLFGRDITQKITIDPITNETTVTSTGKLTLDTKLDDLPGALVDPAAGSLGIRRTEPPPVGSEPSTNRGLITISNDGESEAIDLRDAETIADVVRAINNSKVSVEAKINQSGTGIDIVSLKPGMGELSVVDMLDGTTARDLGLFCTSTPARIQSTGGLASTDAIAARFPTVGDGTFTIEVRDGAGAVLDTYSIEVDTSVPDGDTLGSLVDKINAAQGTSGSGRGLISANLNGGVLNIVSNYDENVISIDSADDTTGSDALSRITNLLDINQYTYTSEAATPAMIPYESKQKTASILGVNQTGRVNEIEEKNIFRTVKNLERALRENDTETITQTLEDFDIDLDAVLSMRTQVGARLNRLDATQVNLEDSEDFMRQELSSIEDVDFAQAVTDLTQAQNAFNAALSATGKIIQQTLLDFLS